MAYMDQRQKAFLSPAIKAVLKKYGMKGSIGVRHHSTLICNVTSGPLDVIGNMYELAITKPDSHYNRYPTKPTHIQVNPYWIGNHYTGTVCEFIQALKDAMDVGNHNRSDYQTDYHDVGWYIDINIGQWDKPFQLVK